MKPGHPNQLGPTGRATGLPPVGTVDRRGKTWTREMRAKLRKQLEQKGITVVDEDQNAGESP